MMPNDLLLSLALGIGLAAAVGFRVFLPLLILGLAVKAGVMPVSSGFDWVATTPAVVMFGVAAVTEIIAYYIPFLDNALDSVAGPVAVAAGIGVAALALGDAPPMLKWTLAIIAGGGAAAATQGATTLLRGTSTVFTVGLGNHALATTEIIGAIGFSLLAILVPYVAMVAALVIVVIAARMILRRLHKPA